MAANHFVFKLAFLFFVLLPIVVSAAFSLERTKTLSKIRAVNYYGHYGLITSSSSVEEEFFDTVDFIPNPIIPYVDLAGRRFHIGAVEERSVIFVRSGEGLVNAAITTQLLLDHFNIYGVVSFGAAGSTNDSLAIGDVVVPKEFVNTGVWEWVDSSFVGPLGHVLLVSDYNVPKNGSNLLGQIYFTPEEFYSKDDPGNGVHRRWFQVYDYYLDLASELPDVNANYPMPNIVVGVKGSSSNIYVANAAYREFLYRTFEVSSVDMESSAIVMTCLSNGYPEVIVFAGLSNLAGERIQLNLRATNASQNVARAVAQFVKKLPNLMQHAQA